MSDQDDDLSNVDSSAEQDLGPIDNQSPAQAPAAPAQTAAQAPAADNGQQVADNDQTQTASSDDDQEQAAAPQTSAALTPISADDLKMDHHATQQDLANGHIVPQSSLFANKSTLGKIGTLFGLMVSGAGAGLTHQPNLLMELMNKQISNDLEAQKTTASNAQNLLRINQANEANKAQIGLTAAQSKVQQTDANTKAYALTKIQANNIALHDLVTKMNALPQGSPQRQQAEQTIALMNQGVQNENYNIADRAAAASALTHAMFNQSNPQEAIGQNQQPAQSQGPAAEQDFQNNQQMLRTSGNQQIADYKEQRHMPGVPGQASVPLTSEDRNQAQSAQALIGSLQRLKDFAVNNPAPLPKSAADIQGKALAAQVQGDFRMATHGGVFKEGEQNFINQVVPGDPTAWSPFAHIPAKIDAVINETAARNNQFLSSKGFPVAQQKPPTQNQAVTSNVKYMNGVPYKKVAGGWAPVNANPNQAVTKR